jgi:SP family sugar:H+ symporter-like MFS transporter
MPYLLNPPYAALGPRVGYIYGSTCILVVVWAYFFVPETKGRSLEELDELFVQRISARKFRSAVTTGAGRRVTAIEQDEISGRDKHVMEHQERVDEKV